MGWTALQWFPLLFRWLILFHLGVETAHVKGFSLEVILRQVCNIFAGLIQRIKPSQHPLILVNFFKRLVRGGGIQLEVLGHLLMERILVVGDGPGEIALGHSNG